MLYNLAEHKICETKICQIVTSTCTLKLTTDVTGRWLSNPFDQLATAHAHLAVCESLYSVH